MHNIHSSLIRDAPLGIGACIRVTVSQHLITAPMFASLTHQFDFFLLTLIKFACGSNAGLLENERVGMKTLTTKCHVITALVLMQGRGWGRGGHWVGFGDTNGATKAWKLLTVFVCGNSGNFIDYRSSFHSVCQRGNAVQRRHCTLNNVGHLNIPVFNCIDVS